MLEIMKTKKQEQLKARYAPNNLNARSDKEPHPENKKQEKEYREQTNNSYDDNADLTDES